MPLVRRDSLLDEAAALVGTAGRTEHVCKRFEGARVDVREVRA